MTSPVHPPLPDSSDVALTFGANLSGADTTAYTETVKSIEKQKTLCRADAIWEGKSDVFILRRAFSLLEILIVVAIVGVLALLTMTLLASLREKSQSVACQSNLRILGAAGLAYASDRNGVLPELSKWKNPNYRADCLYPYIGLPLQKGTSTYQPSVMVCPAIQASEFKTFRETVTNTYNTYSINQYAAGSASGTEANRWTGIKRDGAPVRLGNVRAPSSQAFFMDGTGWWEGTAYRYSAFQDKIRLQPAEGDRLATWRTPYIHQNKINVVFLDGHVEAITRERGEELARAPDHRNPFWGLPSEVEQ